LKILFAFCLFSLPAFAGEASGEFKAGTRAPIRPKYAAAFDTRDQRDARKHCVEVVLSDVPIDTAAAIAELEPHSNVINQSALRDHNYVLLWVRPGDDVSMNATYSDTMTQFIDMTSETLKAQMTSNTPDRVAGRLFTPKPVKTMDGETYSLDLTFSTDVTRLPPGTTLPAGGGEPGKALNALLTAIAKKDWAAIKANVSAKNAESFNDLDDALQTLGIWLPAKKKARVVGGEMRGDVAIMDVESQFFEGQKGLYLVRMIKSGPRWVFDRATRAGLIESK
jgi:hypothetical protein